MAECCLWHRSQSHMHFNFHHIYSVCVHVCAHVRARVHAGKRFEKCCWCFQARLGIRGVVTAAKKMSANSEAVPEVAGFFKELSSE